jgi:hypothetical protein
MPLPIPLSSYLSFFQIYYIDSLNERESIVFYCKAMDRAYLKVMAEKLEKQREESSPKGAGRSGPSRASPPPQSATKVKRVVAGRTVSG